MPMPEINVRWFFKNKDKLYKTCGRDSIAMEAAYQEYISARKKDAHANFGVKNIGAFSGQYRMTMDGDRFILLPIFEGQEQVEVIRGTWFRQLSDQSFIPISQNQMAEKLEDQYQKLMAMKDPFKKANSLQHMWIQTETGQWWYVKWDGPNDVKVSERRPWQWCSNVFKLSRGFNEEASVDDTDEPITKLVMVIDYGNVSTSESLADIVWNLGDTVYPQVYQQTAFVCIEFKSELAPELMTKLVPGSSTTNDVYDKFRNDAIYYAFNGKKVRDEVVEKLNERFDQLMKVNPSFPLENISVVGHSLAALIVFDILQGHKENTSLRFKVNSFCIVGSDLGLYLGRQYSEIQVKDAENLELSLVECLRSDRSNGPHAESILFDKAAEPLKVKEVIKKSCEKVQENSDIDQVPPIGISEEAMPAEVEDVNSMDYVLESSWQDESVAELVVMIVNGKV